MANKMASLPGSFKAFPADLISLYPGGDGKNFKPDISLPLVTAARGWTERSIPGKGLPIIIFLSLAHTRDCFPSVRMDGWLVGTQKVNDTK